MSVNGIRYSWRVVPSCLIDRFLEGNPTVKTAARFLQELETKGEAMVAEAYAQAAELLCEYPDATLFVVPLFSGFTLAVSSRKTGVA
jgi:hypothetical protein